MIPDLQAFPAHPDRPRRLVVLGSTGSIGTQTLEVAALFPEKVAIHTLVAGSRWQELAEQARRVRPSRVVIADEAAYASLADALADLPVEVAAGEEAVVDAAADPEADLVVAAIVGVAGLRPTLAALDAGTTVALSNKEALVVAGALVRDACARTGARVLPVDSEHSALFQSLVGESIETVERMILTASGGPFRDRPAGTFGDIRPADALAHPNWDMGAKVTIDSATLMNKGLEVIEAHWLFGLPPEKLDVTVHPQSIVHSVVEFVDGSSKAQLGQPDMKVPIQVALSFPERWPAPHARLAWPAIGSLDFRAPDLDRFPCLGLSYEALRRGGSAPAALNAADEAAVGLFLDGRAGFTDIPRLVEAGLACANGHADSLDDLFDVDRQARAAVLAAV